MPELSHTGSNNLKSCLSLCGWETDSGFDDEFILDKDPGQSMVGDEQTPQWNSLLSICQYSVSEAEISTRQLLDLSEEWFQNDLISQSISRPDVPANPNSNQKRRIWAMQWGLCEWPPSETSHPRGREGADDRHKHNRPLKRYRNSRRNKSPLEFQHARDFKDYIQQYREKKSEKGQTRQGDSPASVRPKRRVKVLSSVAEVTDLSTLVPNTDQQTEHPKGSKSFTGSESSPSELESSPLKMEIAKQFMDGTKGHGICSKGMAVFRRGVSLNPLQKPIPADLTFDIRSAMGQARKEESRRKKGQDRYLNLCSPKEGQFRLFQPEKNGKSVESFGRSYIDLRRYQTERRMSMSLLKEVQVIGFQTRGDSKTRQQLADSTSEDKATSGNGRDNMASISGIRFPTSSFQTKPGSLFLGYCLSQLTNNSAEEADKNEHVLAAYKLKGRQLHGETLSPRAPRTKLDLSTARSEAEEHPDVTVKEIDLNMKGGVKLGVKGQTLDLSVNQTPNNSPPLGIFDIPV